MAQNRPYLKAATLYISVKDWADIWLNGIPIVDSQPFTSESKGFQTIACIPRHLCYFRSENVLAIEDSDAYRHPASPDDRVGIAYLLRLQLSDGTELTLSSNEASDHKALYLPVRETMEPEGWHRLDFDDGSWSPAFATGPSIPGVASLTDPESRKWVLFLSASGGISRAAYPGERHLYRRKFSLNLDPNPLCGSIGLGDENAPPKPTTPRSKEVSALSPPILENPPAPQRSKSVFLPANVSISTSTPTPTAIPTVPIVKTPTSFLKWGEKAVTSFAPAPTPTHVNNPLPSVPEASPRIQERYDFIGLWIRFTPTPTASMNVPAVAPMEALATPVSTTGSGSAAEPPPSQGETIVFDQPPANIYITFADGPGVYRLEVLDASNHHVKNLFEQRIVAQNDDWVEWDGKDDSGKAAPAGTYTIVYRKGGVELKRITVVKGDSGNP